MAVYNYKVSLTPFDAFQMIKQRQDAELVYEEDFTVNGDKFTGTLIFEKYYIRAKNRAALIVLINNFNGITDIKSISTGSSEGMIFNFDWGAADHFANSVGEILADYIID